LAQVNPPPHPPLDPQGGSDDPLATAAAKVENCFSHLSDPHDGHTGDPSGTDLPVKTSN
jgi:hypothetical protein